MKNKIIKFSIFAAVFLCIGSILWNKINHESTDEIFQEKTEQFYENQEKFEKIVEYVSGFDYSSITENNEMWTDVMIDGIVFRLTEGRRGYVISLYPTKTLLLQLMDSEEKELVVNVIGESSDMDIYYDKKSYNILAVYFSIEDTRLEDARGSLVWHNLTYKPMADWEYPLDENWTIAAMGVGY